MKILKRSLLVLLLLVIISGIAGYFLLNNLKKNALPDYNKDIDLPGLIEEVTILRDSFAIPHIYANNENDLYRSVGFVMARDRLWQMDLLRRVTQGRLSEILGKDQLETDLLMRALRMREKSEKVLKNSFPEMISCLEAYSEGVNFYIKNFPLPPEFKILGYEPELWEPGHSLNLIGYMAWDLTSGWQTEILLHNLKKEVDKKQLEELIPHLENHPTSVFRDFQTSVTDINGTILSAGAELKKMGLEIFHGSNNWAVSGEKSKSGKALLANDMHLGIFAPGIWYQMHHVSEGSVNVTGLVLPGQPFVICGHNDSIAWGMTNVYTDNLDFYAEKLNKDSTQYLLNNEWKNLVIKKEKIKTKEGEEISQTLKFTHRGPLVNRFKKTEETALSIHWSGNDMSNEMRTIYLLNRANNWSDFRNAVSSFISISQNIIYADIAGNIGLQCCSGVPLRDGIGINIYPGDTTRYDWTGFLPFDLLPYEFNPDRGYVSSANNKTVPEDYPYYIGYWYDMPNRIDRIREMLEETGKSGIDDFKRMQGDFKSVKAQRMVPVFLKALNTGRGWNENEKKALKKLQDWDFVMSKNSEAASIFDILFIKTGENLIKDDLSPELFKDIKEKRIMIENLVRNIIAEKKSLWIDDKNTSDKETFDDIIKRSFKETILELTELAGPETDRWKWGKIHKITISHPLGVVNLLDKAFNLNRGPYEISGSYHTVCPYSYSYNDKFNVKHAASHRHIYDLSDWNNSKTIIPTGTSGIPASDFYLDQTERYLNNDYHDDPFSKPAVIKNSIFSMKLNPVK